MTHCEEVQRKIHVSFQPEANIIGNGIFRWIAGSKRLPHVAHRNPTLTSSNDSASAVWLRTT